MKTLAPILALGLIVAAAIGGFFYGRITPAPSPQQLTLEQILSIKELHLVKHTYTDLFFLHKKNNPNKAIRAMVQVPVTITAYLNLKDIEIIRNGDSIRKIILPRAQLNEPVYQINHMTVRETHSFQVHAGKDLYPEVSSYLGTTISERMDTVRNLALTNRIIMQAEAEGLEYVTSILRTLGRADIAVTFGDEATDQQVVSYSEAQRKNLLSARPSIVQTSKAEIISLGFLPLH
jgi:hypothetical protein